MNDLNCAFDREETVLHRLEQVLPVAVSIVRPSTLNLLAQKLASFVLAQATKGFQQPLRARRPDLIMLTLLASVLAVYAQQPSSSAPSQEAISIIDTAIKPIGGEQAIRTLDNCIATGILKQGEHIGTFTWKIAAQEYWSETSVDSVDAVVASNHGKPMRLTGGKKRELSLSTTVNPVPLYHVGMSLLRSRDDAAVEVVATPATTTGPATVQIIQAKLKDPDIQAAYETWAFDPQTGLPTSHTFSPFVYHGRPLAETAQYRFSNYGVVSGVNVPHHIEQYVSDQLIRSFDIQNFQCGVGLSTSDFGIDGGAQ